MRMCNLKFVLMQRAVDQARERGYTWLMYLDADEFLVLPCRAVSTIHALLAATGSDGTQERAELSVNWRFFGSGLRDVDDPDTPTVTQYTLAAADLDRHVKTIVRVSAAVGPGGTPHFYTCTSPHCNAYNVTFGLVRAADGEPRSFVPPPRGPRAPPLAYIAHYVYQAYDVYMARKGTRVRDDNGALRNAISHSQFHGEFNDVVFTEVADLYGARIKESKARVCRTG